MQTRLFLVGACALAVALSYGCATVPTPIPPSEYTRLDESRTYRVVTKSGEMRETSRQSIEDSTLVIEKPRAALHDSRPYPVRIPLSDIESISTVRTENLVYVESGVQAGKNFGVDSPFHSPILCTVELGFISGERGKPEKPHTGYGATMYFAGSSHDFRGGIKARARYRFNRHVSLDAAAGPLLGQNEGFVGSVGVNLGSAITLKSEWMSSSIEPWSESDGYTVTRHPAGTEHVWYNGVTFRNGAGWAAMALEIGIGVAMIMAMAAALASSS